MQSINNDIGFIFMLVFALLMLMVWTMAGMVGLTLATDKGRRPLLWFWAVFLCPALLLILAFLPSAPIDNETPQTGNV